MRFCIIQLVFGFLLISNKAIYLNAQSAVLLLNEVNPNLSGNRDLIELLVLDAGNTGGMIVQRGINTPTILDTMPSVNVALGDIIIIHLNPSTLAGDAPASEITSKDQYPHASHSANFDLAWDFLGSLSGIPFSNSILIVRTAEGTIQDAVPFSNLGNSPTSFPADLQFIQTQGFWLPPNCDGANCDYSSVPTAQSVSVNWSTLPTSPTVSVQRNSAIDVDSSSAWVILSSTFGILNQNQIVSVEQTDPIPVEFKLNQNYPNPFNPSTTIAFDIPTSTYVRLRIFDLLGREITILVDDFRKSGHHEIRFEDKLIASGVYFYRIEAGDFLETKKLVLIR